MAYNNAFILLGITFLFAMPAVLLLRRPKRAAAPPPNRTDWERRGKSSASPSTS